MGIDCRGFLFRERVRFGYVLTDSMAERAGGLANILFFAFGTCNSVDNIFCVAVGSASDAV